MIKSLSYALSPRITIVEKHLQIFSLRDTGVMQYWKRLKFWSLHELSVAILIIHKPAGQSQSFSDGGCGRGAPQVCWIVDTVQEIEVKSTVVIIQENGGGYSSHAIKYIKHI